MPKVIQSLALRAKAMKDDIPSVLTMQLHNTDFVWQEDWSWVLNKGVSTCHSPRKLKGKPIPFVPAPSLLSAQKSVNSQQKMAQDSLSK